MTSANSTQPVDVTVTLPDDMRQRAKQEKLNLSQLLRDALAAEFEKKDAMTRLAAEPQTYEVSLRDHKGRNYKGKIVGKLIVDRGSQAMYATADGRFLFVDSGGSYDEVGPEVENVAVFLTEWLKGEPDDEIIDAFEALGVEAVIEL